MTPETVRKRSYRDAAIGAVLFAALIVLAVLQYRWIGQVSEAEGARLERELNAATGRFMDNFDDQMGRLVGTLTSGAADNGASDQETLNRRVTFWRDLSLHPMLVKKVWLAEDPGLPSDLQPLVARLSGNNPGFRGGRGRASQIPVDASVGALAIPLFRWTSLEPEGPRWWIVQLDLDFVKQEWLPELIAKDFGPEFHVRVFQPSSNQIIFETEPRFATFAADEPGQPLFRFRSFGRRGGGGPPGTGGGPPGVGPPGDGDGRGPGRLPGSGPGARGNGPGAWGDGPSGRGDGPGGRGDGPGGRGDGPGGRGDGPGGRNDGWRVVASYQSGTTSELVASLRRRNLGISFGILMLLGVTIGTLMFSTSRAQALARQQMEFVAGVTHELRTPLAVILSASQNLADGVTAGEKQVKRYGGVIHNQTKRLSGMVEQVLRFAGLSSLHGELQLGPVELPTLIHEAVTDCRPELEEAGTRLTVNVDETLPPVNGDHAALLHALRNLLGNAAKHGGGADVRLTAAECPGGRVALVVEDDGPGVDPADLPHLFEPFYRGQRARQDQVRGSGLGLSLVKKIADAHQGKVEASSIPGHGTRFRLVLPVAKTS